jgi:hypothetical protein
MNLECKLLFAIEKGPFVNENQRDFSLRGVIAKSHPLFAETLSRLSK